MKEHTYRIEIERKVIDTYEVRATSTQAASMGLGASLTNGDYPDGVFASTREISRKVGRPVKITETEG